MEDYIEWATCQKVDFLQTFDELKQKKTKGIVFHKDHIFTYENESMPFIELQDLSMDAFDNCVRYYLGTIKNYQEPIYAIELDQENILSMKSHPLKMFLETKTDNISQMIARARQLLNWHKTSLFCSVCGGTTNHSETEIAKVCSSCQRIIYPTTSLAVIVLVEKENQILLARSPSFRPGVYSVLAGFVEAGEALEKTIVREIKEEVGITVKNIRYFGSQPWPFENAYMVGFIAEYHAGEINPDPKEIEDAAWFDLDKLPLLPYKCSLSRKLIDHYLKDKNIALSQV